MCLPLYSSTLRTFKDLLWCIHFFIFSLWPGPICVPCLCKNIAEKCNFSLERFRIIIPYLFKPLISMMGRYTQNTVTLWNKNISFICMNLCMLPNFTFIMFQWKFFRYNSSVLSKGRSLNFFLGSKKPGESRLFIFHLQGDRG